MAAGLKIVFGVTSRWRNDAERFRQTWMNNETFVCNTDLDSYGAALEITLAAVDAYAISERARPAEVGLHYSITLENITAPTPPAGAWVQAKQHYDGGFSSDEWNDIDVVRTTVLHAITSIREVAKY